MKRVLKTAHRYYYLSLVAFFFILLYPFIYLFSRKPANLTALNRLRRIFVFLSSSIGGIINRYHFEESIDWSKTYIICPNHTSNLDINSAVLLIKRNYIFLGKDELLKNFVTRIYFETIDIPVNRESKMSSFRAFKRAEEYLKQGVSLVIFPEGLISDEYPPVLYPFKNGPFRLAIENNIPILPVTFHNNWKMMWDDGRKYGSRPGVCDIYVHKPIETGHLTIDDTDALREKVFAIIDQQFKKYENRA
ncbi:MAG: lysophospholipid acyltransferase family protein [Daejeonella sp.]